jgi:hypothetical protein
VAFPVCRPTDYRREYEPKKLRDTRCVDMVAFVCIQRTRYYLGNMVQEHSHIYHEAAYAKVGLIVSEHHIFIYLL